MKWLDSITNSMDINLSTLQEIVEDRGDQRATVHEVAKSWTQHSNRTTTLEMYYYPVSHHCDATKTQPVFTIRISFMKCSIITQRTMGDNDALFWQSSFLTMCFGPWVGKIPGEGNSYLLQYSGLENSMDCVVHRVPECWTRLTFTSVSEILLCVQYSYCLIQFCLHGL